MVAALLQLLLLCTGGLALLWVTPPAAAQDRAVALADGASSVIWFPHGRPQHQRLGATLQHAAAATSAATDADAADAAPPLDEIPVSYLLKLSDIQNVTYFLNNFVDTDTIQEPSGPGLENRFGAAGDERKSAVSAKPAICQPHLELVPLAIATDPSMYYYPSCTRIERCGGCCGSNLLACQPIETEIVNLKVIVTQYTGRQQMTFKGHQIIPLERHTKCKCECIKKETDCNQLQKYNKNQCNCICMNTDEKEKCLLQSDVKLWDSTTCSCICREKRDCVTDSYFEPDSCRCAPVPSIINRRRETYLLDPVS